MNTLPGAVEAGERLKATALREFGPPQDLSVGGGRSYKLSVSRYDAPVPRLLMYALVLIGLTAGGPGEKAEWWVNFSFRGQRCTIAHEKFGVRIYLWTEASESEASKTLAQILKKLKSSMRIVEKVVIAAAPDLLGHGHATVINQYHSLRRAYEYFRDRAIHPLHIDDEVIHHEPVEGVFASAASFTSGAIQMKLNAFHDLVAAITSYLSMLEHTLVLALAFCDFDPDSDDLTSVIGSRWGGKFDRVLGNQGEAGQLRQQLAEVVERWRNPYSHGGFEKGHGATIYLHAPGIGALPIGLTSIRNSPMFSLLPASETDVAQVFALFDRLDGWLEATLPHAMMWISSGLAVRFDNDFRQQAAIAHDDGSFTQFVEYHDYRQDIADNMDY